MLNLLVDYSGYLRWIILFSIGFYFYVNRRNDSRLYKPVHIFLIIFSLFFCWIPQGLDITDEGYVLTKSWFMLHGMWHQNVDMTWGSTLLNGFWLSLPGKPDILWARIGYVVLISLIVTVSYKTLILKFDRRDSFITAALLGMLAFSGSPQIISYQNLPVLAIVTGFFYFIKGAKSNKKLEFILSGLFISFSVLLRFPNILLIFFLFGYFLIKAIYDTNDRAHLKPAGINFLIGVSSGLIFGFAVLLLTDSLNDFYINSLSFLSGDNTHSSFNLLKVYNRDLWRLFTKAIVVVLPLLGISLVGSKDKSYILKLLLLIFSAWFAFSTLDFYGDSQNWVFLILAIGISSLILYMILKNSADSNFEIIYCSLLLYFISFIGSNNGMYILFWSGAMIVPVGVFMLLLRNSVFYFNKQQTNFNLSFFTVLLFIAVVAISRKPSDVYRDGHRKQLSEKFASKELANIKSTSSRVSVTDSLISYMGGNMKSPESLFIVGPVPIFYYLLDKKPLITNIWTCPTREFEALTLKKSIVHYFLIPKNDPRDNNWPNSGRYPEPSEDKMVQYYLKYIADKRYEKKYENSMFYVYGAPALNVEKLK